MNFLDRLETTLRIRGGYQLNGEVRTQGAKNAALPIMAASLLAKGPVTLHRVPRITDVSVMWSLLEALGARLKLEDATRSRSMRPTSRRTARPTRWCASSRRPLMSSAPLLGRFGAAEVPLPGGCVLGTRATDMHEAAFRALGADVKNEHGYLVATPAGSACKSGDIALRTPSVGATKNAMLAAVTARATTVIENAAIEPEVVDLAQLPRAMGAKIKGTAPRRSSSRASTRCTASTTRSSPTGSWPARCALRCRDPRRSDRDRLPPCPSRSAARQAHRVRRQGRRPATTAIRIDADAVKGGTDI